MKKLFCKNSKGFTIVELIVVIAVLAIITVVAAPKLIEYVEKARKGTDENAIWEVAHAAEVAYHEDGKKTADNVMLVRIDSDGVASYGSGGKSENNTSEISESAEFLYQRVQNLVAENSYKYKSEAYKKHTVKITVDEYGKATVDGLEENRGKWTQEQLGITGIVNFFADDVADFILNDLLHLDERVQKYVKEKYIGIAKNKVEEKIQEKLDEATETQWEEFNKLVFEIESTGNSWESLDSQTKFNYIQEIFGETNLFEDLM